MDVIGAMAMLIPILALMIPIVAILSAPGKGRAVRREREEARKMYERIVRDKLDVMKTAVAMGYKRDELGELDARLEKLVGAEKLQSLLDETPGTPAASPEVHNTDLLEELDTVRRMQRQGQ